MATVVGTVNLSGCNYQLAYDLLSQDIANNTSTVRLYGILNVTNNYVSWTRGSASVHTSGLQSIGTYYGKGSHIVITKDFTWGHDSNGNFSVYIGASLSTTFTSGDTGGIITLPSIPRQANITYAPDFNDESNPTINYSNPLGSNAEDLKACISLTGDIDDVPYRDISKTGSSYTFELTETERNTLRNATTTSNSRKVKFFIRTKIGNSNYYSVVEKTFSIVNGNPIFNDFQVLDDNEKTVALTGSTINNVINVNGYSNIQATIFAFNQKATAQKGATMVKYRLVIGNSSCDIPYDEHIDESGYIEKARTGVYNVYAIDSRNNSTLVTKLATQEIAYENIYINKQQSSILRDSNQVGENAILTLNGTLWNNSFGIVTNTITSITYRFKKTDSATWIYGTTTITPTITNNEFSFVGQIASDNADTTWDLDASYDVEVTVNDELSSSTASFILNSSIPTLSLDKQGIGVMCAYNGNIGGKLQVDGMIIDGGKLLWVNPDDTIAFSAQSITLDSDKYDIILWLFKRRRDQNIIGCSAFTIKGIGGMAVGVDTDGATLKRGFDFFDDDLYTFGDCSKGGQIANNDALIPMYAIGFETNLFN